jgi:signal transduction histidine kinase
MARAWLASVRGWIAQRGDVTLAALLGGVGLYTVGAHQERGPGLFAMLVSAGVFLIQDGADLEAGYDSTRTDVGFYALFFLAWSAGVGIRALRNRAVLLQRLTEQLARERDAKARLAAAEERTRLARELHDVVAHGVTVMVLQTGAARRVVDRQPEKAKATLLSVEESGRQALSELRRALGILRERPEVGERRPPEGLRDLEDLTEKVKVGGPDIALVVEGEPRELTPGLDLTAFRVVQEALTNVLKHAQAERVTVRVHYGGDELELEVVDDGRGGVVNGDGGGHGLAGLHERSALYGGAFQAGPRPGGGFRVHAVLPFDPERS